MGTITKSVAHYSHNVYSLPIRRSLTSKNESMVIWLKIFGVSNEEIARLNPPKNVSKGEALTSGDLTIAGPDAAVTYQIDGKPVTFRGNVFSVSGLPSETSVTVYGNSPVVHGGARRNFLDVLAHNATINTGGGDNWVDFRSNSTRIVRAGRGNDMVFGAFGGEGYIFEGGEGHDTLEASRNSILNGCAGDDHLKGGQNSILDGSVGDDSLLSFANSILDGGDGADALNVGTDSIGYGGNGNDVLIGGARSKLDGGSGNDVIYAGTANQVDGWAGRDHLVFHGAAAVGRGGLGDDFVTIRGADTNLVFEAGDGHDRIDIHGVASTLTVGGGIDPTKVTISRGENDVVTIDFGNGKDQLTIRFKPHSDYLKDGEVGSPSLALQFDDGSTLTIAPDHPVSTQDFSGYKGLKLVDGSTRLVDIDTWTELLDLMGGGNMGGVGPRSAWSRDFYNRRA